MVIYDRDKSYLMSTVDNKTCYLDIDINISNWLK